jgi:hypothetical protein
LIGASFMLENEGQADGPPVDVKAAGRCRKAPGVPFYCCALIAALC